MDLAQDGASQGITTGFESIDCTTNVKGWPIGEPSIIMGPTGRGKTALATQCMLAMADAGKRVGFATYEMNRVKIKRRMMKQLTGYWDASNIDCLTGQADWDEALKKLNDPFYDIVIFDPSGRDTLDNTVEDLVRWTMMQKEGPGLDGLFVDYIQLLRPSKGGYKKFEDMEAVGERLKKLSMRADIAMVCLSQMNDEGRTTGSKAFEHHSGLIMKLNASQDEIHVAKSRYGSEVKIPVQFDKQRLIYREI